VTLRSLLLLAPLLLAPLGACASGGASAAGSTATHRNPDVISEEEVDATTGVDNAFQLVQRLRPSFLTFRGSTSIRNADAGRVVVYVNQSRMGFAEALRDIPISNVREIRRLSAAEATQRFGTNNSGGAILVTLR